MGNCIPSWFEKKTAVPTQIENSYETEKADEIFDKSQSLDTDSENDEPFKK